MVETARVNEDELASMEEKVLRLNGEIDVYIGRIRENANRYRQCTS